MRAVSRKAYGPAFYSHAHPLRGPIDSGPQSSLQSSQRRWATVDAVAWKPRPDPLPSIPILDLPVVGNPGDPFSTAAQQAYLDSEPPRPKQPYYPDVPLCHRTLADEAQVQKRDPTTPGKRWDEKHKEEFQSKLLSFKDIASHIDPLVLKAATVRPLQFRLLSPTQNAILPLLPDLVDPKSKKPRDLLVQAPVNSGKKLAYLIPAIQQRLANIKRFSRSAVIRAGRTADHEIMSRAVRAFTRGHVGTLVISPTREAATHIANTALKLAHWYDWFEVRLFVGGESRTSQLRDFMKGGRDIVVGTPGRLRDMLDSEVEVAKGIAKTSMLVIDEAELLLDMGFRDDIDAIVAHIQRKSPSFQAMIFTSQMSTSIEQVAKSLLSPNHLYIDTVKRDISPLLDVIAQFHTVLPGPQHQIPHLLRLIAQDQLTNPGKSKVVVFVQTTRMAQLVSTLVRALQHTLPSGRDTNVYELHSKRSFAARTTTHTGFRDDKSGSAILIASDVSARTMDLPGCSRVLQLGLPLSTDFYTSRVSKAGNTPGVQGRADLVLLPWEIGFLTWRLGEFNIKPCTVGQLAEDVSALAQKYDEKPTEFFPGTKTEAEKQGLRTKHVRSFVSPVKARIENIVDQYERLLPSIDELAVKETFASLLGFYIPRSPELRVARPIVVQGCKDWAKGACGLEKEPYVSDEFLRRLGMNDGRTSGRFGQHWQPAAEVLAERAALGRNKDRLREELRGTPAWAGGITGLDPNDPSQEPEQFRTTRRTAEGAEVRLADVKEAQALAAAKHARIAAGLPFDDLEPSRKPVEEREPRPMLFPRELSADGAASNSSEGPSRLYPQGLEFTQFEQGIDTASRTDGAFPSDMVTRMGDGEIHGSFRHSEIPETGRTPYNSDNGAKPDLEGQYESDEWERKDERTSERVARSRTADGRPRGPRGQR